MNPHCHSAMDRDVVQHRLERLLNEAIDVRQRYHRKLVELKKIADGDFTRPLSREEFACLRQVWIDDTQAYMSDFDWTNIDLTCRDEIERLKELHFRAFFAAMSTVEDVFAMLVCHAFVEDKHGVSLLLQDLSMLPSMGEEPAQQKWKRRKTS